MVAVHPVEEVQAAVEAEREQVVGGDGLRLARLADHEELREDGDRLEVDGEGPEDLEGAEVVVDEEGEPSDRNNEKLSPEKLQYSFKKIFEFKN